MCLWCSNSWHQRQRGRKKVGGQQLLGSHRRNWPGWLQGVVKDFRVPIGIYRLDKGVSVQASVPIAARSCCRGCMWTKQGEGLRRVMLSIWNREKEEMVEKWIRERHIEIDWSQGTAFKYPLWEKSGEENSHSSGIQASLNPWHRPENEAVSEEGRGEEWEEGERCAAETGWS